MRDAKPLDTLTPDNLTSVDNEYKNSKNASGYLDLLYLLADIADTAIRGDECYATFGLTRDGTGLLLTVTHKGRKFYAAGSNLVQVASEAKKLL